MFSASLGTMIVQGPIERAAGFIDQKSRVNAKILALAEFDQRTVLKKKKITVAGIAPACFVLQFRKGYGLLL